MQQYKNLELYFIKRLKKPKIFMKRLVIIKKCGKLRKRIMQKIHINIEVKRKDLDFL